MSAGIAHPSLRARTAQALAGLLDRLSNTEVGAILGIAPTTVARRGADLRAWPADELLLLAAQDAALAEALRLCVTGDASPAGQAVSVVADLIEEIADSARINGAIAAAMREGRVSPSDAGDLITEIQRRRRHEDEHLLPDLLATVKGGAR